MKNKLLFFSVVLALSCIRIKAQTFYDISKIQRIEISFTQSNWDYILDTAKAGGDTYLMSKWVKINGVQFDSAGVKYKGNSSYNPNNAKNPLHIELDHYKNQDYQGIKDIKLSNGYNEPSFVREVMTYSIFSNYSESSRANFAQVIINGVYMGLYTNVEAVTKTFLNSRYYTDNYTFVFADNGGCNLKYKGNDSTLYYNPYTLKSNYGWTHLMRLCDTLRNNITGIENNLDVDRTLWLHAYTNAFVILDSYLGNSTHNYYLYRDHNGRFNPIIWDLNGSIGIFNKVDAGPALTIPQMQSLTPNLHANDSMWPLVKNLLAIPLYKHMYIAHMKTLMNENIANGTYSVFAQYLQGIADTAVLSDPNKFGSYAQFTVNLTNTVVLGPKTVPGIFPFMNARLAYLNTTAEFTVSAPTITNVASSNPAPALNSTVFITADITNATAVYLGKRYSVMERFRRTQMFDDGAHGDGAPADGKWGVAVPINSTTLQYYVYADNANAGLFSPARAEHEYYTLNTLGNPTAGQIVINEFLSLNKTDIKNEFNLNEDWIELYNTTGTPLNLGGFYLTDDFSNKTKFAFTQTTVIPANGFLLVWADGVTTATSNIHANFKLSENGEQIMLSNGLTSVIDSLTFGNQTADKSTGRCPDGTGSFTVLTVTSPGMLNCPVGISEKYADQNIIELFPNPANEKLKLKTEEGKTVSYELLDITGRKIHEGKTEGLSTLDVSKLENGTYFLRLIDGEKTIGVKKFLIVR